MVQTFALLLVFQLAGELLARIGGWPVPGPVVGLTLLFFVLLVRGGIGQDIRAHTGAFLQQMSLLFIPAGVGVTVHLARVAAEWLPILAALLVSTFAGMAVCAWTVRALLPKSTASRAEDIA